MIYEQDIWVLKSVDMSNTKPKREIHYHKELTDSTVMPDHNMVDVHKCEEAFLEGYAVALRGMEFRSETIAAIADGLAVLSTICRRQCIPHPTSVSGFGLAL